MRAIGLDALGGLSVWLLVVGVDAGFGEPRLGSIALLLLFGQLVIVPLGLLLFAARRPIEHGLLLSARVLFRFGGVAALVTLAFPRGELSGAVAAVWAVPALLVGVAAAIRAVGGLRSGNLWRRSELAQIGASAFLVVGAFFFVLYRGGIAVMGFGDVIIHLTAVHFVYTGFGLLLIAGQLARRGPGYALGGLAVLLLLAGMIVTPIGFMTLPLIQLAGVLCVVAGLLAVALGTVLRIREDHAARSARPWLAVAAASPLLVGGLATVYAIGEAVGTPVLSIDAMVPLHGAVAAVGVVFCGLLGWRLVGD